MTEEEAAMEAMARYDQTMAETTMRAKTLLMMEMFGLAEVTAGDVATAGF